MLLTALLLGVEFFDELYSGIPSVAFADIRAGFGTSYSEALAALWVVPGVVALLVEPWLFLLADRYPRRWFVSGGLLAMAAGAFVAASATEPWMFALSIVLAWLGSGSAVSLGEASLVDMYPEERERVLARWAILGELGDLCAPVLLGGLAIAGLGWRIGFVMVGSLLLLWAVALSAQTFSHSDEEDDDESSSIRDNIKAALANRPMLVWLGGAAFCDLLDELLIVFAAIHMRDSLGFGETTRAAIFSVCIVGAIVGAMATERLLARMGAMKLLIASCVSTTVVYALWLAVDDPWSSGALMAVLGVVAAPQYPVAIAQAYKALPGRSGTVNAAAHLYTPVGLAIPVGLGWLAGAYSTWLALSLLVVQPVMLFVIALWQVRSVRVSDKTRESLT